MKPTHAMLLLPVAAGVLLSLTGIMLFDPLAALAVGAWLIVSTTTRELRRSSHELIWPADATCGHAEPDVT